MRVKYTGRSKTISTISIERIWSHLLRNPKWKTSLFVQWFRFNMRYFLSLLTSVNYWETYEINLWFLCRAFSSFVWVRFWCELLLLLCSSPPLFRPLYVLFLQHPSTTIFGVRCNQLWHKQPGYRWFRKNSWWSFLYRTCPQERNEPLRIVINGILPRDEQEDRNYL